MYGIFKDVILRGDYKLDRILAKIEDAEHKSSITSFEADQLKRLIANTATHTLSASEMERLEKLKESMKEEDIHDELAD